MGLGARAAGHGAETGGRQNTSQIGVVTLVAAGASVAVSVPTPITKKLAKNVTHNNNTWTGHALGAREAALLQGHQSVVTAHVWPGLECGDSDARLLALLDSGASAAIMDLETFEALPGAARPVLLKSTARLGTIAGDTQGYMAPLGVVTLSGVAPDGTRRAFRCTVALVPKPIVPGWRFNIIFPLPQHAERAAQYFFDSVALGLPCAVAHDASPPPTTAPRPTERFAAPRLFARPPGPLSHAVAASEAAPSLSWALFERDADTARPAPPLARTALAAAAALPASDSAAGLPSAPSPSAPLPALTSGAFDLSGTFLTPHGAFVAFDQDHPARSLDHALGAFAAFYSATPNPASLPPVDYSSPEAVEWADKLTGHLARQGEPPISSPHTMTAEELSELVKVVVAAQTRYKCFDPAGPLLAMPGFPIPTTRDEPYNAGHLGAWRKFSPAQLASAKQQIDAHVRSGKWVWYNPQLHATPWVHALVFALKDQDTPRLAVNYIPLNERTISVDQSGQPSAAHCLTEMIGYDRYLSLDAADWHFQLPTRESDIHKTGLLTPWGILLMKSVGQGQTNSSSYGQAAMENALQDFLIPDPDRTRVHADPYQDDAVLGANDSADASANLRLIRALERVLARSGPMGVRWRLHKFRFCVASTVLLGEIISKDGRKVTPERLQGIRDLKAPADKAELRSFLGLMGHFRVYVKDFSGIAAVLTDLTQLHARFIWTREHQAAFLLLKNSLLESNVLGTFPRGCRAYVYTDGATRVGAGLGGWIVVELAPGTFSTFAFWSRKLTPAESHLSPTDVEATAGADCMEAYFHVLRHAREIIWVTDHLNLTWFARSSSSPESVLRRTARAFDKIFYELGLPVTKVLYNKGENMFVPDALSRLHGPPSPDDLGAHKTALLSSLERLGARLHDSDASNDLTERALRQESRSWGARRINAGADGRPNDPPQLAAALLGLGLGQTPPPAQPSATLFNLVQVSPTTAVDFERLGAAPARIDVDDAPTFSRPVFDRRPVSPSRASARAQADDALARADMVLPVPAAVILLQASQGENGDARDGALDTALTLDAAQREALEALLHGPPDHDEAETCVDPSAARVLARNTSAPEHLVAGLMAGPGPTPAGPARVRPTELLGTFYVPDQLFKDVAALQRATSVRQLQANLRGKLQPTTRGGVTVLGIEDASGTVRILIPQGPQRDILLAHAHDGNGHFGVERTYQALLDAHVVWPGMRAACADHTARCVECLRTNGGHGPLPLHVGNITGDYRADRPFQEVQADFAGPFPTSAAGNSYILILVDKFSRFVVLAGLAKLDFNSFATAFREHFTAYFDAPETLVHDGGPPFNTAGIDKLIQGLGVTNDHTTHPKHPSSIGLVERTSATVIHLLQKLASHHPGRWCTFLPQIQAALNRHISASTGAAPRDVVLRLAQPSPLQRLADVRPGETPRSAQALALDDASTATLFAEIRERDTAAARAMAEKYNSATRPAERFRPGDRVFVWTDPAERASSSAGSKLSTPFAGPYTVLRVAPSATVSKDFYELAHCHESRTKTIVRHVSFLRRDTSGMSDLDAQLEARPVEEVRVVVVDHYDQRIGRAATRASPDGTYFKVTYTYPDTGPPWFFWNTLQANGRFDYFYRIASCQDYLRKRGLELDASGHVLLRADATAEQRQLNEAHELKITNSILTKTTDRDLLDARAQLPTPAPAPPASTGGAAAPRGRRRVTIAHDVVDDAPVELQAEVGHARSEARSEANGADGRPPPLYSMGMALAKRSTGAWGIASAPVWINDGISTPGYRYYISWRDATDRTKNTRASDEDEAALEPKIQGQDGERPRRARGGSR